ncbi:MAG TPA: c-type cytochrome [Candidatus Eisenbacteria bacterium]|nr:c-type cytochrome [Candidatus Eisenbacteria bacterium]
MNYPVWDVSFGAGLLIALIAVLHVFVSHFAVGGGLYLVLTEKKARRSGDVVLLSWLKSHTNFFVLVTVVFGAVSGVGIWFTIGLISPMATSNLIHAYVWGWAIEWVFFFLEISAALFYLYGWDKLEPKLHLWFGWIYFLAAYASLVIINGIITFMLTSGHWVDTHKFWIGFFNPTYFPSLLLRTLICFALAGIYALITASVQKDKELKARIVRWSALWVVPSLLLVPAAGWWYIRSIPADLWASARGPMPTGTHFAILAVVLLTITFLLALIAAFQPKRLHLIFSLLIAVAALGTMGSFEFVREAIRKPFVIGNYLYANSIYATAMPGDGGFNVDKITEFGVLRSALWIENRDLTPENQKVAGHEIFRMECQSCHTADAYRGLKRYLALRQWDQNRIQAMIGGLDLMHNGVMPPFAGTDAERQALAAYLSSLHPVTDSAAVAGDGRIVFERNCSMCHRVRMDDLLFSQLPEDPAAATDVLKDLPGLFPRMPDLKLSEGERSALARWVNTQRAASGTHAAGKGSN